MLDTFFFPTDSPDLEYRSTVADRKLLCHNRLLLTVLIACVLFISAGKQVQKGCHAPKQPLGTLSAAAMSVKVPTSWWKVTRRGKTTTCLQAESERVCVRACVFTRYMFSSHLHKNTHFLSMRVFVISSQGQQKEVCESQEVMG